MKHIACIAILLTLTLSLSAKKISSDVARQNALEFLSSRQQEGVFMSKSKQSVSNSTLTLLRSDDNLYVFNIGTDDGFVIISGSDQTQSVLGYADNGQFNSDDLPEALQDFINEMSSKIERIESGELTTPASMSSYAATTDKAAISPLIKTQWGQNYPFNLKCPTISGVTAPTGCVATSMSQVMYYFKHPTEETSTIPSYSGYNGLAATTFDWDAMQLYYNCAYDTDESCSAVAKLMLYAGHAVKMGYSATASGATIADIPTALEDCFGYASGGELAVGANYEYGIIGTYRSYSDWEELLYNELSEGYPIILSGVSSTDYGHAFILDGYDGSGYFHINWGWEGSYDGFFSLCLLNATTDNAYPFYQTALLGIRPYADETEEEDVRCGIFELSVDAAYSPTVKRTSTSADFSLKLYCGIMANVSEDTSIETNFDLYDSNGNVVAEKLGATITFEFPACETLAVAYSTSVEYNLSFGSGISSGTYFIKGVCRELGDTEWKPMLRSSLDCLEILIDGNSAVVATYPTNSLTVNSITVEGNLRVGNTQKVKANITNNGAEFFDQLYLIADNSVQNDPFVLVREGETTDVYFDYTPQLAGVHTLYLSKSESLDDLMSTATVSIQESTKGKTTLDVEIHTNLQNDENANAIKYLYSDELTFSIDIKNVGTETYDSYITLIIFVNGDYGNSYGSEYETKLNVAVDPGETKEYSYTYSNMKAGRQYLIIIYNDEDKEQARYQNVRVGESSGITSLMSEDTEESCIYTAFGTVAGRASAATLAETMKTLPSGIYIFRGNKILNKQ